MRLKKRCIILRFLLKNLVNWKNLMTNLELGDLGILNGEWLLVSVSGFLGEKTSNFSCFNRSDLGEFWTRFLGVGLLLTGLFIGEFELFINISSEFLEGFGGSGAGTSCWPSWTRFGKTGDPGVAGVAKSGLGVNSSSSSLATKRCPVIASPGLIEPLKPPFPSSFSLKKFGLTTVIGGNLLKALSKISYL